MAYVEIKNFCFAYNRQENILNHINLTVNDGEIALVLGRTGSGKSTLLSQIKPELALKGTRSGTIDVNGTVGYVMQNPSHQIVTPTVWQELAFPLENQGVPPEQIRMKVAEMANFFGIADWFLRDISELSGGMRQMLNLASAMLLSPDILVLDEPTSQLDPISAVDFLEAVNKINRDLGVTVIITEHRLEEIYPLADRILLLEDKMISIDCPASEFANKLNADNAVFKALPSPIRIYSKTKKGICPMTVREGRIWLNHNFNKNSSENAESSKTETVAAKTKKSIKEPAMKVKNIYFAYERKAEDVLNDLSFNLYKGELLCLLGANSSGKTTLLKVISGLKKAYNGKIEILSKNIKKYSDSELYGKTMSMLPQNPSILFKHDTVEQELKEINPEYKKMSELLEIEHLISRHPYDLSGGEQQKLGLAKVLLNDPKIILLDEPTKALDAEFKEHLANIFKKLCDSGVSILMATHDIEFAAMYADRCLMMFDGSIAAQNPPREFFSGNHYYTTAANRMARGIIPDAIICKDVIEYCEKSL